MGEDDIDGVSLPFFIVEGFGKDLLCIPSARGGEPMATNEVLDALRHGLVTYPSRSCCPRMMPMPNATQFPCPS